MVTAAYVRTNVTGTRPGETHAFLVYKVTFDSRDLVSRRGNWLLPPESHVLLRACDAARALAIVIVPTMTHCLMDVDVPLGKTHVATRATWRSVHGGIAW